MKLTYDQLLSNVAFNFNLRHYIKVVCGGTQTLAIISRGRVVSFGNNDTGTLGRGALRSTT